MGSSLEEIPSSISVKTMMDITGFIMNAVRRLDVKKLEKFVDMLVEFYPNKQGSYGGRGS